MFQARGIFIFSFSSFHVYVLVTSQHVFGSPFHFEWSYIILFDFESSWLKKPIPYILSTFKAFQVTNRIVVFNCSCTYSEGLRWFLISEKNWICIQRFLAKECFFLEAFTYFLGRCNVVVFITLPCIDSIMPIICMMLYQVYCFFPCFIYLD